MRYLFISCFFLIVSVFSFSFSFIGSNEGVNSIITKEKTLNSYNKALYDKLDLNNKLDFYVFNTAMEGYNKIQDRKKDLLTIIDFSKPSTEQRFFIIDLDKEKVLVSSVVSHGKNSGSVLATSFSNKVNSHKSSLGFFLTENTYMGRNGYSLVLDGLEKNINDNAKKRHIVIHGASYANPNFAKAQGRLGRSYGCPALPRNISKHAIDLIKGGSVIYSYANSSKYFETSLYV